MRGIVVVDQPVEDRVVGWHVSVGAGLAPSKPGAWVLPADDPRIERLLTGRVLVTTARAAARFGRGTEVTGLAFAIIAETSALDAVLAAQPVPRQAMAWPRLATRPTAAPTGDAQSLVRWVSDLLRTWEAVERQRLACPALVPRGGQQPRPLPPGWPAAATLALAA